MWKLFQGYPKSHSKLHATPSLDLPFTQIPSAKTTNQNRFAESAWAKKKIFSRTINKLISIINRKSIRLWKTGCSQEETLMESAGKWRSCLNSRDCSKQQNNLLFPRYTRLCILPCVEFPGCRFYFYKIMAIMKWKRKPALGSHSLNLT